MANADTNSNSPVRRPSISVSLMKAIAEEGAGKIQAELGMDDERWMRVLEGHALAIYCWENQAFGQAIGYQPELVG